MLGIFVAFRKWRARAQVIERTHSDSEKATNIPSIAHDRSLFDSIIRESGSDNEVIPPLERRRGIVADRFDAGTIADHSDLRPARLAL